MTSCRLVVLAATMLLFSGMPSISKANAQRQESAPGSIAPPASRAMLERYCVSCHNQRAKTAGLMLDTMDLAKVATDGDVWEKVIRKLRAGMMPPPGLPRPERATSDEFVSWLEATLDHAALGNPNPGLIPLHRLNRAEYGNAIRDLLALDVDVTSLLPADDSSSGFDNIADVLGVPPLLLERYLSAAQKISSLAVGDLAISPSDEVYRPRPDLTQTQHVEGLPLGTRGGLLVHHTFPVDGEYVIKPRLWQTNVGFIRGLNSQHDVEITVDGERVYLESVGTPSDYAMLLDNQSTAASTIDARLQVRVHVKAGQRSVGVAFVEKTDAEPPTLLQPFLSANDAVDADGVPKIDQVTITGPFGALSPGDTASRRQIFVCRPQRQAEENACAKRILSSLARRAYRRPVIDADLEPLLEFYRTGRRKGNFEAGIQMGLRRILASPAFLFRIERDPANLAPGTAHRIDDLELASRLSFFLWSSIPDEQLLSVASRGALSNPSVFDQQVRRMLRDERAEALVTNFGDQWLYVRNLASVTPDLNEFPDFDDNLRQAFRRETELFLGSIVREDHSVLDLLSADYTFVNERLARHYGIPNVYGSQFRRVAVTDDMRKGLLGQGSILTVTSQANRTSPVKRGKWILDNILGTPVPPPPPLPGAGVFAEPKPGEAPKTMREQMEIHRTNPICASCHKVMDPIGLALENFDAIGAWRTRDGKAEVNASGELVNGTKVNGPATLRQAVLAQPELFVGTMTEKLLAYAIGRGLDYRDMPAVRAIVRQSAASRYSFSSIVIGITKTPQFRMRLKSSLETRDQLSKSTQ